MNSLKLFLLIYLPSVAFSEDYNPSISNSKFVSHISYEIPKRYNLNSLSNNKIVQPISELEEIEVGKWTLLPGSILIIKKTNDTYWL